MSEEIKKEQNSIEQEFEAFLSKKPSLVSNTVPTNKEEAKAGFLNGDASKPDADFSKLQANSEQLLERMRAEGNILLRDASVLQPQFIHEYRSYIEWAVGDVRLGHLMDCYNQTDDVAEKARIRSEFMKINIEIFGEPDKDDYQSALHDKIKMIKDKELTGIAATLRNELIELTSDVPVSQASRYKPSPEAIEWYRRAILSLCEPMLERVPEGKDSLTGDELEVLFRDILRNVFEDAAADWDVVREKAASVNVRTKDRRIVIPEGYKDSSIKKTKELIVHELGTHLLRSVMGDQSDMPILRVGLSNYYDSEEGAGKAAEHAINGTYEEAGLDHLITAGLVHHGGRDYRSTFEIKWRLKALEGLGEGDITEEAIAAVRDAAYDNTMRTLRGTGELPWFKDLAYFYGPVKAWRYIESIVGDELGLTLSMLGKTNPADRQHRQVILESATAD